jgi:hypothetical protein
MADIKVTGPDGSTFSFPEGTRTDVITSAMQKHYGATATQNAPNAPEETAGRVAGLAGRAGVKGVIGGIGGLPALAGDAGYNAYVAAQRNLGSGPENQMPQYGMPVSGALENASNAIADYANLPTPVTPTEKILSAIGEGGVSALTGAGAFRGLGKVAGSLGAEGVAAAGDLLGANAGQQAAAGAIGGGVSQGLNQAGVDPRLAALGGMVAAPLAVGAGRRIATPAPSSLTPEQQRLAQVFQSEVGPLSAGQSTGSKWLQYAEDYTSKLPLGDLIVANPRAGQSEAFTQAALSRAGVDAKAATPTVLDQGFEDIGQKIGDITGKYNGRVDSQFANDLHDINANYGINLSDGQKKQFSEYVSKLLGNNGNFTGENYQKLRSQLGGLIRGQVNAENQQYRGALQDLQGAFDDLMQRSMGTGPYLNAPNQAAAVNPDIASLKQARQQYANLNVISKALSRSGQSGNAGLLSPQALSSAMKSSVGQRNYSRGVGDMNDLARAGAQFLPTPPSSGTGERNAMLAYGTAINGGATLGGLTGALKAAAIPFAAQIGINSPLAQAYFRNQKFASPTNFMNTTQGGLLGANQ